MNPSNRRSPHQNNRASQPYRYTFSDVRPSGSAHPRPLSASQPATIAQRLTGDLQPIEPKLRRLGFAWSMLFVAALILAGHLAIVHVQQARAAETAREQTAAAVARTARISGLDSQINAILAQHPGIDYSIAITDLDTGATKHFGSTDAFTAASTAKLITAVDFLHEVEQGSFALTDQIDGYSAQDLLKAMIVNSDDDSWVDLNDTLTYGQIADYVTSIGINDYDSADNLLTSSDIALLLQQLYNGKLLNTSDTQLLLSYMKQANFRDYIVPAVPSGDTIYHKVGLVDDNVHDAAIITSGTHAFALVIFSDGNGDYDWTARAQTMQAIASDAIKAYL